MEDVQAVQRGDNHRPIHYVEVQLSCDDSTIPAVDEFNGSVYRSGLKGQNYFW